MNSRVKDMTRGAYAKTIILFALPLMLGSVFQQMYTLVDTAIVGRFVGVSALASIGATDWLIFLVFGIILGFTQGFSILIAQRFGAQDQEGLRRNAAMAALLSVGLAVVCTAVAEVFVDPVLTLLNTPQEAIDGSRIYLRVFFAGIPALTMYNLLSSVLRALGNSRTPLIAMIVASFINIGLDLLFVLGFGWGIAGAAAATVIAQVCSGLLCLRALRKIEILHMSRADWKPDGTTIKKLLGIGVPIAAQNSIIAVGGVVMQYIVNGFDFVFVAGFTATNKVYGVLEIAAISLGYAVSTFTGQNLGAKQYRRIREGVRVTAIIALGISLVITTLMLVLGPMILGLFVSAADANAPEVLDIAYRFLQVMSLSLALLYTLYIYRFSQQGLGNTLMPMVSGFAELVMRVGAVLLLPPFFGQYGVFLAEPLAWGSAAVILLISYYYLMRKYPKENEPMPVGDAAAPEIL